MKLIRLLLASLAVTGLLSASVWAAEKKQGPVTKLPIPRFVSLKAAEANVRRGPSLSHKVDWVYKRRSMPLQVTAEFENWRRVRDQDGAGGWVHYTLLTGARTALVEQDLLPLYDRPDTSSPVAAHLQLGVIGRLGKCDIEWCHLDTGGYDGWTKKSGLWGVEDDEIRK